MSDQPDETFDLVLRNAMFAASDAAIDTRNTPGVTPHEVTKAAVRAAFQCALGNRMITITPQDSWPEWIACDPPYDPEKVWDFTPPGT